MENTIKSIFYYPKSLTFKDYCELYDNGTIAPRTIVFAEDLKAIYKDGVQYGRIDYLDFKEYMSQIFETDPYILPIATAFGTTSNHHIGGVMAGDYLTITDGGKLNVDIDALSSFITDIFTSNLNFRASNDKFGIVRIGNGIDIDSTGTISVNVRQGELGPKGDKGDVGPMGPQGIKGDTGPGFDPSTDPTILEIQNLLGELEAQLYEISSIDVDGSIRTAINAYNNLPWNQLTHNNQTWDSALNAYLTSIGLVGTKTDDQGNRVMKYNYSEIIQHLDSIESSVGEINSTIGGLGYLDNVEDIKAAILAQLGIDGSALTSMQTSISDWDSNKNSLISGLANVQNEVTRIDNNISAITQSYTGVLTEDEYLNSLFRLFSDESKSNAEMISSVGTYDIDPNTHRPVYEIYNGHDKYMTDADNKAIPYTGMISVYTDTNGVPLPQNTPPVQKQTLSYNQLTGTTSSVPMVDDNNNPVYEQRFIKIFYLAESTYNDYWGADHYVTEAQLKLSVPNAFDINNNLVWDSANDSTYGCKFIIGCKPGATPYNIAYRKKKKMTIEGMAGFVTRTLLDDYMAEQFTDNVLTSGNTTIKSVVLDEVSAMIATAMAGNNQVDLTKYAKTDIVADASVYVCKIQVREKNNELAEWTDVPDYYSINYGTLSFYNQYPAGGDGTIYESRIKRDLNDNIIYLLDSGTDSNGNTGLLWQNTAGEIYAGSTAPQEGTWTAVRMLKTEAKAGLLTRADIYNVSSELFAKLDGKYSSIESSVSYQKEIRNGITFWLWRKSDGSEEIYHPWNPAEGSGARPGTWTRVLDSNVIVNADNLIVTSSATVNSVNHIYTTTIAPAVGFKQEDFAEGNQNSNVTNQIFQNGSGSLAKGNLTWDTSGNIEVRNAKINGYMSAGDTGIICKLDTGLAGSASNVSSVYLVETRNGANQNKRYAELSATDGTGGWGIFRTPADSALSPNIESVIRGNSIYIHDSSDTTHTHITANLNTVKVTGSSDPSDDHLYGTLSLKDTNDESNKYIYLNSSDQYPINFKTGTSSDLVKIGGSGIIIGNDSVTWSDLIAAVNYYKSQSA